MPELTESADRITDLVSTEHAQTNWVNPQNKNKDSNSGLLLQGVPKKMWFKPIFEFLTLGGVFLGVKNNSKNFKNKKNIRLFSKILSKRTFFNSKSLNFLDFIWLFQLQNVKNPLKSQNIFNIYVWICINIDFCDI